MNEILARIREKVGEENLTKLCKKEGCRVSMQGVPSTRILVDVDKVYPNHEGEDKRCDYVLFFMNAANDMLFTVPMELKRGSDSISKVPEKLRWGVNFAARLAQEAPNSTCAPILFHGRGIHENQRDELNRAKTIFHNTPATIKMARCNRPKNLANALLK